MGKYTDMLGGGKYSDMLSDTKVSNQEQANQIVLNGSSKISPKDKKLLSKKELDGVLYEQYYKASKNPNATKGEIKAHLEMGYGEGATATKGLEGRRDALKWALDQTTLTERGRKRYKDIFESTIKSTAGSLSQIPTQMKELNELKNKWAGGLSRELEKLGGVGQLAKQVATPIAKQTPLNLALEAWGKVPEGAVSPMQEWGAKLVEDSGQIQSEYTSGKSIEENFKVGDYEAIGADIATAISFETPRLAMQIGLSYLGGSGASLGFMGATSSGSKRAEKTEADSIEERVLAPLAVGIIETLTEKIGTQKILDRIGATDKIKSGTANRLTQMVKDAFSGGTSEGLATLGENVVDRISGEDGDLSEGVLMSAIVGSVMDASVGTMAQPWSKGDASRARKTLNEEQKQELIESDPLLSAHPVEADAVLNGADEDVAKNVEALNKAEFDTEQEVVAEAPVDTEATQDTAIAEEAPSVQEGDGAISIDDIQNAPLDEMSDKAQKILNTGEKVKGLVKPFVSLTTRIGEISPEAKMAITKMDQQSHIIATDKTKLSREFVDTVIPLKKRGDWNVIKADILNGDWGALRERGVTGIEGLQEMFQDTAKRLDLPSTENYFRRKVKDLDGLITVLGRKPQGKFSRAINARKAELGRELSKSEIDSVIRNEFRTKEGSGLTAKRTIETVTPEMAEFYSDPVQELENYIRQTSQAIARREGLGIESRVDESDNFIPTEETLVTAVGKMAIDGNLTSKQENELKELLTSSLEYKRSNKFIDAIRRLAAIKYVTKVKTTVKQFGDIGVAIGENGIESVLGVGKESNNWSEGFNKDFKLSLESIGLEKLDFELRENKRALIEEALFTPLTKADLFNKSVLAKSTARSWRKMAESNPDRLKKKLMRKFDHQEFADKITTDMSNGEMTADVKFALYSQMADFHPISHNQHIKWYIDNPVLRPVFILKSFAFKRFDRMYREAYAPLVDGVSKLTASAVDKDASLRAEGADDLAYGVVGLVRFLVATIGTEVAISKLYKEVMQALDFAPEEIPEDESWTAMYMQELSSVAPFIDPYTVNKVMDRKDPWLYVEEAFDLPAIWGTDISTDLWKHFTEEDNDDLYKWKKDILWAGEFLYGKEKVETERDDMRKRKREIKGKDKGQKAPIR